MRKTYADGHFYQDPRITDAAIQSLRGEEAFMSEAKLLKGTVKYDSWIDQSYLDKAYKLVDGA